MEFLPKINPDFNGYQTIINLYERYKDCNLEVIDLTLSEFFAANMSSPLGGILDKLSECLNEIKFYINNEDVEKILKKNGFLSFFGFDKYPDTNNTTIKYLKLNPSDSLSFNNYILNGLLNRSELPKMSFGLKKKMAEAIYEIFENAKIHSMTKNIYTCGQFFPKNNTIKFTITDTGIGFKNKINKMLNMDLTSIEAIKWAIYERHTTKIGIPGGLGLVLLNEFIDLNKGSMQIISDDGFYQRYENNDLFETFHGSYPGSIVNLQFQTDDVKSYELVSEISLDDIF